MTTGGWEGLGFSSLLNPKSSILFPVPMTNNELQALRAIVFIDAQTVHGMYLFGQHLVVSEQYRLDDFSFCTYTQFEMFSADHALILHDEVITELRGREALPPHLFIQYACHFQIHFGNIQCAIGFNALRQVARTEQFAGHLFKGGDEVFKVILSDAQTRRCSVPAEFFNQRGMALADQIQRVAQMQSADGTS